MSVGFIDIGWFEILLFVMLFAISGASIAGWYYVLEQKKRGAHKNIAVRDVQKIGALLSDDLKELQKWVETQESILTPQAKQEVIFRFQSMAKTIANMKKYLGKEISRLK